jgi:predicted outer membrane repeat protein
MRTQKLFFVTVTVVVLLLFSACELLLPEKHGTPEGLAAGMGRVTVTVRPPEARTAMPGTIAIEEYAVAFARAGIVAWSNTVSSATITADLEPGIYTVTVSAKSSGGQTVAEGSGEVTATSGESSGIQIQLAMAGEGTGYLRYSLNLDDNVLFQYGTLSVYTLPAGELYTSVQIEAGEGVVYLPTAYYRLSLSAFVLKEGVMQSYAKTSAVHIYVNHETALSLDVHEDSSAEGTEYTAGTAVELDAALASIKAGADQNAVIKITANFSHAPVLLIDPGYNNKAISIQSADPAIKRAITLAGNGPLFTVGAAGGSPVSPIVVFSEIKLAGHSSNNDSLLRISRGTVILDAGAEISGNTNRHTDLASYHGGGITVESGALLKMYGGAVKNNTLSVNSGVGGGIIVSGTFELHGGSVDHNTVASSGQGGGIAVDIGGLLKMYGGNVEYNAVNPPATNNRRIGGGIVVSGTFEMYGGTVGHNTLSDSTSFLPIGGGVHVGGAGVFAMYGGDIEYNYCYADGGGIYTQGQFTFEGGNIHDNEVTTGSNSYGFGGGIFFEEGTMALNGGAVYRNTARYGGGISIKKVSAFGVYSIVMDGTTVSENTASCGGGIALFSSSTFTIQSGTIENNYLAKPLQKVPPNVMALEGGGIYAGGGTLRLNGGTIQNNGLADDASLPAHAYGGGISLAAGSFTMTGGSIQNNSITATANVYGGGVYSAGNVTISGGSITGNTVLGPTSANGAGVCAIGNVTLSNAEIAFNTAGAGTGQAIGGGIYSEGAFAFSSGVVRGNDISIAASGGAGGVYVAGTGGITMSGGVVAGNRAKATGGGIVFGGSGSFMMRGGVISGNSAGQGGGVLLGSGIGGFQKNFYGGSTTCGVIYGSEAEGTDEYGYDLKNTGDGAAVFYSLSPQPRRKNTTVDGNTTLFHNTTDNWAD